MWITERTGLLPWCKDNYQAILPKAGDTAVNSTGLRLFQQLCDLGNALDAWRNAHPPGSDDWCACTRDYTRP